MKFLIFSKLSIFIATEMSYQIKLLILEKKQMNRITFITILLFVSNFSFGQSIQTSIVKERVLDQSLNHTLIGISRDKLLGVSTNKGLMHVDIYDKDSLALLFHEQIRLIESEQYTLEIEGLYKINDQYRLVVTGFSLKFGLNQFAVFIYDVLDNGKLGETVEKKLFSAKEKSKLKVLKDIRSNSDNTQLLIHIAFESIYKNNIDHTLLVYDENRRNLYEFDHPGIRKTSSGEMHGLSFHLDNNNRLYEVSRETLYNKSIKKFQTKLELKKFAFNSKEALAVQSVALPDGFLLSEIRLMDYGSGIQLIASYLSSSKKDILGIRGVFAMKFNEDLSVRSKTSQAFSKTTKIKSLSGFENIEKLDVPTLYKIHDCITDSRGNTYVLYERESVGKGEFYFGSIIAVKITNEGMIEWDTFIAKSQFFKDNVIPEPLFFPIAVVAGLPGVAVAMLFSTQLSKDTRQYLSFKPMLKNDELFLIYNDNPENEGRKAGQGRENMTKIKGSIPFAIHLSATGSVEYSILRDLKKESGSQRIVYSILDGNILFTLNDSGKTETLQRIILE
jgi:hypothetical protein